jgi:hypothetical protein
LLHFSAFCRTFSSDAGANVQFMEQRWTPRRQGDAGELSAMFWLASQGADVFIPLGTHPDCDLLADWGDRIDRVQVKTSGFWRNGRWEVRISTSGGNQSWNGIVKYMDPSRCDRLFVHVGDGRRWFIPSTSLGGRSGILLGGPRYAQFEIDPGRELPHRASAEALVER